MTEKLAFVKALANIPPLLVNGEGVASRYFCGTCNAYGASKDNFPHLEGCRAEEARARVIEAASSNRFESPVIEALAQAQVIPVSPAAQGEPRRIFECQGCKRQGPVGFAHDVVHEEGCSVEQARAEMSATPEEEPGVVTFLDIPLILVTSPSPISTKRCLLCDVTAPDVDDAFLTHEKGCEVSLAQGVMSDPDRAEFAGLLTVALSKVPYVRVEDDPQAPGRRMYECPFCSARGTSSQIGPIVLHDPNCLVTQLEDWPYPGI